MLALLLLIAAPAEDRVAMKAEVDAASVAWVECVYTASRHVAGWPEPIDALAIAAMSLCSSEEGRFRILQGTYFGLPTGNEFDKLKGQVREQSIAAIVRSRHGE